MKNVALLVEGSLDESVLRVLAGRAQMSVSVVYGKKGVGYIKSKISGFNNAAVGMPMVVLADLKGTGEDCAPSVTRSWLQNPHSNLVFRLAVCEIESWLLADSGGIAEFLGVSRNKVPLNPDQLPWPKRDLIRVASQSRRGGIKRLVVPSPGSGLIEGPGYTSEMKRFALDHWNVDAASDKSLSLQKCIQALDLFQKRLASEAEKL